MARTVRWSLVLLVLGGGALFAYRTGLDVGARGRAALEQRLAALEERLAAAGAEKARLAAEAEAAQAREQRLRARYAADVPRGETATLLAALRGRLEAGVSAERIEHVIAATEEARRCDGHPATKRFYVSTPIFSGANDTVSFFDGAVTVRAEGRPTVNPDGSPEGWFDPAHPISIHFVHITGKTSEVEGALPLRHSMVVGAEEYVFNVVAGERGFVRVTGDHCRFP